MLLNRLLSSRVAWNVSCLPGRGTHVFKSTATVLMSLTHALARSQQHLPDAVLDQCSEADRVIVENIGLVAQETLPALHLAQATIVQDGGKYLLRIPFTAAVASVTLRELRMIQTYNPARVHDIRVGMGDKALVLRIDICNEQTPLACSELEVLRLTKRTRWF